MVLYVYGVSVLRPAGRKTDTQRIEQHRRAKALLFAIVATSNEAEPISRFPCNVVR